MMTAHIGTCVNCGILYKVNPSYYRKIKNPACSRSCAAQIKSKLMQGKGNHQYNLKGELNKSYLSDLKLTIYGYIKVRCLGHPNADCDGFVFMHRLVVEHELLINDPSSVYLTWEDGYPFQVLSKEYIVHHIDGNKLNNFIGNLEVETLAEHSKHHYPDKPIVRNQITGRYTGLQVKGFGRKLHKAHKFDAGLDISATLGGVIKSNSYGTVDTGLFIEVPKGYVGIIWSRSGLAMKHGIHVGAGCVDSGYTGEVRVVLYNHSNEDFTYEKGDRIAQLLTIPINVERYVQTDEFSNTTNRGTGGFGSTGK